MERMEMKRVEDTKQGQGMREMLDTNTQSAKNVQMKGLQTEVPCCCPGCFPFDL